MTKVRGFPLLSVKEIISQIIEEILSTVVSKVEAGEVYQCSSTNFFPYIKAIRQWEQDIGAVSSHQTVLVSQVGHRLETILQEKYSQKKIKFRSSWGQDGHINIF